MVATRVRASSKQGGAMLYTVHACYFGCVYILYGTIATTLGALVMNREGVTKENQVNWWLEHARMGAPMQKSIPFHSEPNFHSELCLKNFGHHRSLVECPNGQFWTEVSHVTPLSELIEILQYPPRHLLAFSCLPHSCYTNGLWRIPGSLPSSLSLLSSPLLALWVLMSESIRSGGSGEVLVLAKALQVKYTVEDYLADREKC